jgi:hypothetical protein
MRCRLLPISSSAPSAVCASEMPSLALRAAWLRPRICVVKRSEIARPAASSLALLIVLGAVDAQAGRQALQQVYRRGVAV